MLNKRDTASQLLADIQSDPAHVERERALAAQEESAAERERAFLAALSKRGVSVPSLAALVEGRCPVTRDVVDSILQRLPNEPSPVFQEMLVRVLAASPVDPMEGRTLTRVFEETDSVVLRWAIANTLAEARPMGVSEWLLRSLQTEAYGKTREMLALAVARHAYDALQNEYWKLYRKDNDCA